MVCPSCGGTKLVKNGHIHNGKQRFLCRGCGRQFTPEATKKVVSVETKAQIDKLLLEKIPLAGIARAMDVSETWLQGYVNQKYQQIKQQVVVAEKKGA
jgi:insertion element IS1 protein InsB